MMGVELGNYITGASIWFGLAFVAGLFIATTTNIAGAFGDKTKPRDAMDWLIWVVVPTFTIWVVGQGVFWGVHLGRAIQAGAFLPGSG